MNNIVTLHTELLGKGLKGLTVKDIVILRYLMTKVVDKMEDIKVELKEIQVALNLEDSSTFHNDLKKCFVKLQKPSLNIGNLSSSEGLDTPWLVKVEYHHYRDGSNMKYCVYSFHPKLLPYLIEI
jgi:hypothetical protein